MRKQSMQLASKMRFLAAQFDALLTDELWHPCASPRQRRWRRRWSMRWPDCPG